VTVSKSNAPLPIDILKYWLLCIRYEEAVAARPKAHKLRDDSSRDINLLNPASDRMYFKISLDDAALLLEGARPVTLPVEREIAEFFEAWLAKQYRFDKSDEGPEIMVMCPATHLSSGDLAGLIRFQVTLDFAMEDGLKFQIPSRSDRRRGRVLSPPTRVRIERVEREEGPPFFVDPRLSALELGVLPEELEALFSKWRDLDIEDRPSSEYLQELLALLGTPIKSTAVSELLVKTQEAVSMRMGALSNAPKCYPIALVLDASRARPTYHLQRELEMLLRSGVTKQDNGLLWSYLTGTPLASQQAPLLGLFENLPITESQRQAASHFLGSKLTAVEGPPGTGKTSVILHLAAHRLVSRIAAYISTGVMPKDITVVCSTNNRAVDNVIDRLGADRVSGISALGFRVGNRRVCETVSVGILKDALHALLGKTERDDENFQRLKQAKKRFKALHRRLSDMLLPQTERGRALAEKQRLEDELKALAKTEADDSESLPSIDAMKAATALLLRLEGELIALSDKCRGRPNAKTRKAVERFYETVVSGLLDRTQKALLKVNISKKIFSPPSSKQSDNAAALSSWEDAAEAGIDAVEPVGQAIADMRSRAEGIIARRAVLNKLAALHIPQAVDIDEVEADMVRSDLFNAAVEVRSAHTAAHAKTYTEALTSAINCLETAASLRRMKFEVQEKLKELFPIWGCTLLSMGNVFEDDANSIGEIIIDEAGQCHPAYAVSALCRAKRAMVLGDVHQLTPIYGLSEAEERPLLKSALKGNPSRSLRDFNFRVFDKSKASVQETAEAAVSEVLRLTDHFRCQKEIIEISNRLCGLNLTVHTPRKSRMDLAPFLCAPVICADVKGEAERLGGSRFNQAEVLKVCDLLESMRAFGILWEDIAVITPYRGQLLHLRRAFSAKGFQVEQTGELMEDKELTLYSNRESIGIALGTVHRFQGGERSIVIFSTVISDESHLRFLNERVNLINVAVSRAMDHLLIVGDFDTLSKGRYTRELVKAVT
jgi:hypothetical protein